MHNRFFTPKSHINPPKAYLNDTKTNHHILNVMRFKEADRLRIFDGEGREFLVSISNMDSSKIELDIIKQLKKESVNKRGPQIILATCVPKLERFSSLLNEAVQLGVDRIIPIISERSTVKSKEIKPRWQRIVMEATRQSERLFLPKLEKPVDLKVFLKKKNEGLRLVFVKGGKSLPSKLSRKERSVWLMVGPEGGFSKEELSLFDKGNWQKISLSRNTLRVETAASFAVGLLMHKLNQDNS